MRPARLAQAFRHISRKQATKNQTREACTSLTSVPPHMHDPHANFIPGMLSCATCRAHVRVEDMQWTVNADVAARLVAVALPGAPGQQPGASPTFAYVFQVGSGSEGLEGGW